MQQPETGNSRGLSWTIADLVAATAAIAVGLAVAIQSIWVVGVLVSVLILVCWTVRRHRHAAIPGGAIAVLLAWAIVPATGDQSDLLTQTAFAATTGASINALICRQYVAGFFGLGMALTVLLALVVSAL